MSTEQSERVQEARAILWEQGNLTWKLSITQKKMYNFFHNETKDNVVINCSRRLGKSYLLTIMAFEQCLKFPKSIVKFFQPKTNMIRKHMKPTFLKILEDCPKHLRPEFKTQDNMWTFPNGSEIHLAGTDNGNAENIRGGDCSLALIDEAGFCDDLEYIVDSIIAPTTTLTFGRTVLCSTTPPNPDHDFIKFMTNAENSNHLIRKTIYDAYHDDKLSKKPRITEREIEKAIAMYKDRGGELSDGFRTEFMCEVIYNSKDSVIPEFTKEIQQDTITSWIAPKFFHRYVSMDIGFTDLTVVLYGYWDWDNAVLVVEDETVINGNELVTPALANAILQTEERLWMNPITGEVQKPYLRVADNNNPIMLNDLQRLHNISFLRTDKTNKDAALNQVRMLVQNRQIIINPRCKVLISHLKSATWDKSRKDFKRSPDNGHYDAVDSLIYLVRNIDMQTSPYPPGYKYQVMRAGGAEIYVSPYADKKDQSFSGLENMIGKPRSSFRKKTKD